MMVALPAVALTLVETRQRSVVAVARLPLVRQAAMQYMAAQAVDVPTLTLVAPRPLAAQAAVPCTAQAQERQVVVSVQQMCPAMVVMEGQQIHIAQAAVALEELQTLLQEPPAPHVRRLGNLATAVAVAEEILLEQVSLAAQAAYPEEEEEEAVAAQTRVAQAAQAVVVR